MNRRIFLAGAAAAALVHAEDSPEAQEQTILARIRPPKFPQRDFDITKFGARAGADSSSAIRAAIAACAEAGGGRVVIPPGEFLTAAIHLRSRVELHVSQGATLRFSRDPKDYLPVVFSRWEGTECMNYSPFIYAFEQTDIAITGSGVLDGQADAEHWWPWKKLGAADRKALQTTSENGTAVKDRVFGDGRYLRPQFIQPYRSNNVLIEDVTIRNSPMWEIHPVLCRNVTVRNVKIDSHGPNNDGCDPECCSDVLIEGCTFDTGDDCIAIKSGRNADGRRIAAACENLIVRNCIMKDGHGGVSIGSEISGGVRNVFVSDCRMSSPHLDRALRIKTNAQRGGVIENVWFRKVTIGEVATDAVQIDFYYEEAEAGPFKPVVRNIRISDVICAKSNDAISLRGFASSPIRDVRVSRCAFEHAAKPNVIEHVEGLVFEDVTINGKRL
ncbi:MAG TPA: glycoside hydrolase family 28 protein [Bryobacteraceae bacterium]|jgi:polygalacturonase|nr:glycoside hydrolase family 28 protein [Bryobacteraceae bacterium]